MDLTGYTWAGNNSLTITTQDNATYNINGEGHFLNNQGQFDGPFTSIQLLRSTDPNAPVLFCNNTMVYFGSWNGSRPFTIEFTGGTDATNATLIAWLEANGTLTAPATPSGKTKLGTLNIAKKMFGTLPIVKEVVDGMVVYEKTITPSYQVTITDARGDGEVYIYDGTNNTGTLLFSGWLTSTTVSVSSGNLFITTNQYFSGTTSATGGVTYVSGTMTSNLLFTVSGDGTITLYTHD